MVLNSKFKTFIGAVTFVVGLVTVIIHANVVDLNNSLWGAVFMGMYALLVGVIFLMASFKKGSFDFMKGAIAIIVLFGIPVTLYHNYRFLSPPDTPFFSNSLWFATSVVLVFGHLSLSTFAQMTGRFKYWVAYTLALLISIFVSSGNMVGTFENLSQKNTTTSPLYKATEELALAEAERIRDVNAALAMGAQTARELKQEGNLGNLQKIQPALVEIAALAERGADTSFLDRLQALETQAQYRTDGVLAGASFSLIAGWLGVKVSAVAYAFYIIISVICEFIISLCAADLLSGFKTVNKYVKEFANDQAAGTSLKSVVKSKVLGSVDVGVGSRFNAKGLPQPVSNKHTIGFNQTPVQTDQSVVQGDQDVDLWSPPVLKDGKIVSHEEYQDALEVLMLRYRLEDDPERLAGRTNDGLPERYQKGYGQKMQRILKQKGLISTRGHGSESKLTEKGFLVVNALNNIS